MTKLHEYLVNLDCIQLSKFHISDLDKLVKGLFEDVFEKSFSCLPYDKEKNVTNLMPNHKVFDAILETIITKQFNYDLDNTISIDTKIKILARTDTEYYIQKSSNKSLQYTDLINEINEDFKNLIKEYIADELYGWIEDIGYSNMMKQIQFPISKQVYLKVIDNTLYISLS